MDVPVLPVPTCRNRRLFNLARLLVVPGENNQFDNGHVVVQISCHVAEEFNKKTFLGSPRLYHLMNAKLLESESILNKEQQGIPRKPREPGNQAIHVSDTGFTKVAANEDIDLLLILARAIRESSHPAHSSDRPYHTPVCQPASLAAAVLRRCFSLYT